MAEERQVIRLGRREGVAGDSRDWQIDLRGRRQIVDREWLKAGLKAGRLTGIEPVRRTDGDWGPLFGRPVYREVFRRKGLEPRDHAKARANEAIARDRRGVAGLLAGAAVSLLVGLPGLAPATLTAVGLFAAAGFAVGAGVLRLRATMRQVELESLKERLVPPVTPPPPIEEEPDWAWEAARDEVDAYLAAPSAADPSEGAAASESSGRDEEPPRRT